MKNTILEFIPFEHKNLDYINTLLNLARQQRNSQTLEGAMSSTVLFANVVEYLANNLVENLEQMFSILTKKATSSVFFIKCPSDIKNKKFETLGKTGKRLDLYHFPDNQRFLENLNTFRAIRNKIFHKLPSVASEELSNGKFDRELSDLQMTAEEILDQYNSITQGITTSWIATRGLFISQVNQ